MADQDFIHIYTQLGVSADCSLAEFKNAYRRRVRQLHPDRNEAPVDSDELQRLNVAYDAALTFQRQYHRLPGASLLRHSETPFRSPGVPLAEAAEQPMRIRGYLFWLLLLAGAALVMLAQWERPLPPSQSGSQVLASTAPASTRSIRVAIHAGARAENVRASLGAPITRSGERWEYGPSWIQFRDDVVIDWYSSPLRPLTVAAPAAPNPRQP